MSNSEQASLKFPEAKAHHNPVSRKLARLSLYSRTSHPTHANACTAQRRQKRWQRG